MSKTSDPSRDLLFGLLALQNGLIDQGALFAAFAAWTRDKGRSLADHLVDPAPRCPTPRRRRGHRRPACPGIGGDPEKSLAVAGGRTLDSRKARAAPASPRSRRPSGTSARRTARPQRRR